MPLRFLVVAAVIILLAAIAVCALSPSSYMSEIRFIPSWLATWADANPNFRNMPVFAALAALVYIVVTFDQPLATRYGLWRLAFGAFIGTTLLGVALEALQLLLPGRWADPLDVMWSALGALVGVSVASFAVSLFKMRYSGNSANATSSGSSVTLP
jgi:VanZ family protein